MPNTRDIRRRIKSVKNTQQITRALQTVSASKMSRAQMAASRGRDYSALLNRVLVSLRERVAQDSHLLLAERPVKKELTILISTDKGLCGALNTNLFREASRLDRETTDFVASGRKAVQYLARTKRHLVADFVVHENVSMAETRPISQFALDRFLSGEVDKVNVVYTRFVNTLTQTPTIVTLLPISAADLPGSAKPDDRKDRPVEASADPKNGFGYIFAPGEAEVLDAILPQYVHFLVYQMILNAPRERTQCAHGRDEERDRQCQTDHQGSHTGIQQGAAGRDHHGAARNHQCANGTGLSRLHPCLPRSTDPFRLKATTYAFRRNQEAPRIHTVSAVCIAHG